MVLIKKMIFKGISDIKSMKDIEDSYASNNEKIKNIEKNEINMENLK